MLEYLAEAFLVSLKISFVYVSFKRGMIFHFVYLAFEWFWAQLPSNDWLISLTCYLRKPLYGCIICMASIWGILFSLYRFELSLNYLLFLFTVGGLNYLISTFLSLASKEDEKDST